MSKTLAFSVKISDCETQTFRSGGKGGQHQNKTESGVRVIHHASGARGESREHREQPLNKAAAFRRMAETVAFKLWVQQQIARETPEQWVEKQIVPANLRVEVRDSGSWQVVE